MRLDDLHCTGLGQDGRDLQKDMESINGIKQETGKTQQRQEQKVRT